MLVKLCYPTGNARVSDNNVLYQVIGQSKNIQVISSVIEITVAIKFRLAISRI